MISLVKRSLNQYVLSAFTLHEQTLICFFSRKEIILQQMETSMACVFVPIVKNGNVGIK